MIANYHTHTPRCTHAVGEEEEYVLTGVQTGLKILGFSDHAPFPFPGGYYSHIRMRPEEFGEYTRSVLELRQKYAGQIQIPLGVEIEYFPQFWDEQLSMLRDGGVEYLLLGQHWSQFREGGHYNGRPTDSEALLAQYCKSLRDAMQTGQLTYIAHPDLFPFLGEEKLYQRYMGEVCREAKSCNIPLEINLLGVRTGRKYPDRRFWALAGEEGCKVVLGWDAHAPDELQGAAVEAAALDLIREFDLELLETVPLQRF